MYLNVKELFFRVTLLNFFWTVAKTEYFAVLDLEPLLNTEAGVVNTLEKYLEREEKRLEKIKRYKDEYQKIYKTATSDTDIFLSNPVNAYLLVKRLTIDWQDVVGLINLCSNNDVIEDIAQKEIFPSSNDLEESASALLRLQVTYSLNITQLSRGEIAEMRGISEFTASDCFVLGLQASVLKDFGLALLWYQEALNKLRKDELESDNKSLIFEFMAFAAYSLGDLNRARKLTKDILAVNPNHLQALKNLVLYEKESQVMRDTKESRTKADETKIPKSKKHGDIINFVDAEKYKRLCGGDSLKSPSEESTLYCRYTTSNSKYLLLQPVKEEVLNLDPRIVVYHDVIRDGDIELLKELSGPLLERAAIINRVTGLREYAPHRISKSGWLADADHPRVRHISLMIEEITGLETDTAESLQVNKYGIGGHYEAHYDFKRKGEADPFAVFGTGNRIATWLFYLSDVTAGGSTIFPDLNVQAKPEKGSAAFWFNLLKSGEGDLRTKHAACPVLAGTKWVANKWIHEREQEFRRPCSLNPLE